MFPRVISCFDDCACLFVLLLVYLFVGLLVFPSLSVNEVKGGADNVVQNIHEISRLPIQRCLHLLTVTVVPRGALEDAAQEDTLDDLQDSDDDLSASSGDEGDLEEKTERMPEPETSKSARVEGLSTSGTLKYPSEARVGHSHQGTSHVQTRGGIRPTVAFQMQEMEGSRGDSEVDTNDAEANHKQEQDSTAKGKGDAGGTDGFLKEYMVSEDHG